MLGGLVRYLKIPPAREICGSVVLHGVVIANEHVVKQIDHPPRFKTRLRPLGTSKIRGAEFLADNVLHHRKRRSMASREAACLLLDWWICWEDCWS